MLYIITVAVAGGGIALGIALVAVGQGWASSHAMDAIARQPDAQGPISRTLFVALAMLESLAIYVLVVELILLFANPLLHNFIR
jgi:F-type H+-transporting ATPase subunit c